MDTSYPPVGFYFQLQLAGSPGTDNMFQEVSGLNAGSEIETVPEGGQHPFEHRLPTAAKYANLVLKRGFVNRDSPLASWCQATLAGDFTTPIQLHDMQLSLLNADGTPLATWSFREAWPVKWRISEFKAQGNALAIESLELAYADFQRL